MVRAAGRAVVVGLAALGAGQAAAANQAPRANEALADVVVTASRQGEQSLQTLPMAISVVDTGKLDEKGVGGVNDFIRMLPSVSIQSESAGVNKIDMRGIVTNGTDISNVQDRPLVQLYLDDAPLSLQSGNPNLQVYDLERVEVLRGPQGTLYGAGSMSGTIRLLTKKPNLTTYSGDATASVSSTDHGGTSYSVRGAVNLPLIQDSLGARLVLYRGNQAGFIDNVTFPKRETNAGTTTQGRAALRWRATDALTLDASATIAKLDLDGRDVAFPQLGRLLYAALAPQETLRDNFKLFNLTATLDLPIGQLISSSSYIDRDFTPSLSLEYLAEAFLTGGVTQPSTSYYPNHLARFTEELRLVSGKDAPFKWITGAYFENFHRRLYQDTPSPGFDAFAAAAYDIPGFNSQTFYGTPTPDDIFYGTQFVEERQFALFGEATFALSPRIDFTVGLRYYNYKTDFNVFYTGIAGADLDGSPITQVGQEKSTGANPRAVLSYKASDELMLFVEAARGFRYGGVNQPISPSFCGAQIAFNFPSGNVPISFGPDKLWSYSLGEKATFANNRVTLNATAFLIDWRDVQTNNYLKDASGTECGYYIAQNQGKVRSRGLEIEPRARLTNQLTVGVSGSLTDASANGAIDNLGAADGNRVPYFPKQIVSAFADYSVPVGSGRITLTTDWTFRSDSFNEFNPLSADSSPNPNYRRIPSANSLNASVSYEQGRWSVGLFASNLTNSLQTSSVEANVYPPNQPGDLWHVGRPRTVGINLHAGF